MKLGHLITSASALTIAASGSPVGGSTKSIQTADSDIGAPLAPPPNVHARRSVHCRDNVQLMLVPPAKDTNETRTVAVSYCHPNFMDLVVSQLQKSCKATKAGGTFPTPGPQVPNAPGIFNLQNASLSADQQHCVAEAYAAVNAQQNPRLGGGAILGITVGCLFGAAAVSATVLFCCGEDIQRMVGC